MMMMINLIKILFILKVLIHCRSNGIRFGNKENKICRLDGLKL